MLLSFKKIHILCFFSPKFLILVTLYVYHYPLQRSNQKNVFKKSLSTWKTHYLIISKVQFFFHFLNSSFWHPSFRHATCNTSKENFKGSFYLILIFTDMQKYKNVFSQKHCVNKTMWIYMYSLYITCIFFWWWGGVFRKPWGTSYFYY